MFAKKGPRKITEREARPVPRRAAIPAGILFRMFVIGSIAVLASVYAVWRYYTVPYQPMLVPKPAPTEIEIEPLP
ncbi:MAG: hypothetical protein KIT84_41470 [Labilithrix sp.]|nr:hypothetical protein [Labilithrix sp.]MCW5817542.1 hypothetical protein [Labilithrix sp.]